MGPLFASIRSPLSSRILSNRPVFELETLLSPHFLPPPSLFPNWKYLLRQFFSLFRNDYVHNSEFFPFFRVTSSRNKILFNRNFNNFLTFGEEASNFSNRSIPWLASRKFSLRLGTKERKRRNDLDATTVPRIALCRGLIKRVSFTWINGQPNLSRIPLPISAALSRFPPFPRMRTISRTSII